MTTEEKVKTANSLVKSLKKHKEILAKLEKGFVSKECSSGIMLFVNGEYIVSHDTGLVNEGPLTHSPMDYVQAFIDEEIKLRRDLVNALERQLNELFNSKLNDLFNSNKSDG